MSDVPIIDLSGLTLATGRSLVGLDFVRRNDAGPDVVLRLVSAEPARRDPTADGAADRPFSLVFHGPPDPRLTQGMHDLEHPEHRFVGLFLVPVGAADEGLRYEAVFS
ncbi:hypothetical protein H8E07_11855 [bacterium]|nr:hypothetical protein [bacterium]